MNNIFRKGNVVESTVSPLRVLVSVDVDDRNFAGEVVMSKISAFTVGQKSNTWNKMVFKLYSTLELKKIKIL